MHLGTAQGGENSLRSLESLRFQLADGRRLSGSKSLRVGKLSRADLRQKPIRDLASYPGENVTVCGLINADRSHHQITGDQIKPITICDYTGIIECEIFAQTYRRFGLETVRNPVIKLEARVAPFESGSAARSTCCASANLARFSTVSKAYRRSDRGVRVHKVSATTRGTTT